MSSVVCQGLRSCLKPRLIEPIVLRHKLTPPLSIAIPLPQNSPQHHHIEENSHEFNHTDEEEDHNIDHNKAIKKDDLGGWSFLSLANPSQISKQVSGKTEKAYVHPMVKSFASTLSSKSLEMCTESLGCETGSDISENNEEFCSVSWEKERLIAMRRSRQLSKKVVTTSSSFPPPLTSISGSDGVRVKPHREGGRLVIKAVSVSSSVTNFQAERTNGRLKLSLVKECSMKCQFEMAAEMKEEEEEEEAAAAAAEEEEAYIHEEKDGEDAVDNHEGADNCKEEEEEEEEEEYNDDAIEEEEGYFVRDMEGNIRKFEGGIGMGEISRPSRCKEGGNGNKGIPNWGSYWVAIS